MNPSPLETLHEEFFSALKARSYIGPAKSNPDKLEKSNLKSIRLHEVFSRAKTQIETDLAALDTLSAADKLAQLKLLKADGKGFYLRYEKATSSWLRIFLKGLSKWTPAFLKAYLPSCFSNTMADAEAKTKKKYNQYNACITGHIRTLAKDVPFEPISKDAAHQFINTGDVLSDELLNQIYAEDLEENDDTPTNRQELLRQKRLKALDQGIYTGTKSDNKTASKSGKAGDGFFDIDILDDDDEQALPDDKPKPHSKEIKNPVNVHEQELDRDPIPLPDVPALSHQEIEEKKEKELKAATDKTKETVELLEKFDERPLSLTHFKALILTLTTTANKILALDPDHAKDHLAKLDIQEKEFKFLTDDEVLEALTAADNQKLGELIQKTAWNDAFTKASSRQGYYNFALQKLGGLSCIRLADEKGTRIQEKELQVYQGTIRIVLGDNDAFNDLNELLQFMQKNPDCRPCTIEINAVKEQKITKEFADLLIKLSSYSAELIINGIEEIDFKAAGTTAESEHTIARSSGQFVFPDLKTLILSDQPKADWTAADFSSALSLCPTLEMLKEISRLCTSPEELIIPSQLMKTRQINLSGFSPSMADYLINQLDLEELDVSGSTITDKQIGVWIACGRLDKVTTLHLNNCSALTTDCLHYLKKLPNLTVLSLPDLPAGKLALQKLPSFDDPFKINLFYLASEETRKIAAERYVGPATWAAVFQIPLARAKEPAVFNSRMSTLDPASVAFWMYQDDYQSLEPQDAIRNVLADSNGNLTDANIVDFMQKFPKATALSLYNCPHVTSDGIIQLLKKCPQIQTVDLTGCPQISESLFFGGDDHVEVLKKLRQLIITGTGISSDIAGVMQESLGDKIRFEETVLTITNDQLDDDDSLEKILSGRALNTLKRIDLENCTNLTDTMLKPLLDRMNADMWIKDNEETVIDNPQRLDLAVLNLYGCTAITDQAFDDSDTEDGKVVPKHLGNLDRVIKGGTKMTQVLAQVYPKVTFQDIEAALTFPINPDMHVERCHAFRTTQDEEQRQALAKTYLFERIAVELFAPHDQPEVQEIRRTPVDVADEQFCDIMITFQTKDDADPSRYQAHRDVLYSKSLYFVRGFRPGGQLSRQTGLDYINIHATPEASQAIMDILYGKATIEDLDWETAAHAAELAGDHIFKLPGSIRKQLLDRFHSQFELSRTEKMLMVAQALEDQEGIDQFEGTLLFFLESLGTIDDKNVKAFRAMANIAKNFNLPKLKAAAKRIEDSLTDKLIRDELHAQQEADEALIKSLLMKEAIRELI